MNEDEARLEALRLAINGDDEPKVVVARAGEYLTFLLESRYPKQSFNTASVQNFKNGI